MEKILWLSVVPEEVPGRDAAGTEVVSGPVAVTGVVGLIDC